MNPHRSPLLTDLYQLTMLEGYLQAGMDEEAVFEFFVRRLPSNRGFLVSAGLDTFLRFLEDMRFSEEEILFLERTGKFSQRLLSYLADFRFRGDVYAMPEGTIFFAGEPVVRVVAPLPEAQLVETRLINIIHYETLIASKAARCTLAASGRAVLVDFGLRRAHGAEAGILAARANFIGGFASTSNVLAEFVYGIPSAGTMAHSFIEAHDSEEEAFLNFARANPGNVTLLIDTYDTENGAKIAVRVAKVLAEEGIQVRAVRIDSGDLLQTSQKVRRILDESGFRNIGIFISGNIDEYIIKDLLGYGAPVNGFGVGTKLDTSEDVPYMDCAYKLMEYAGKPRFKKSEGKITIPGRKVVFRQSDGEIMKRDIVTVEGDYCEGQQLIIKVMEKGNRLIPECDLKVVAGYVREQLDRLPSHLKELKTEPPYPVEFSPALLQLQREAEILFSRMS
ncbi:MAG: nicotinate phosphoribosyltransferase [Syntrophales bacterium]|nr:nicotinate phosphoribosyltransferase [Syntrophales bacterium]